MDNGRAPRVPLPHAQAGFTLVELLVVVLIIAALTAIAVPMFISQQFAAQRASVEADVHHVGIQMETRAIPDDGTYTAPPASSVTTSEGVIVRLYISPDATSYFLEGTREGFAAEQSYYYSSADGGVLGWGDDDDVSVPTLPALTASYGS